MRQFNEALTFLLELAMLVCVPLFLVHAVRDLVWQISLPVAADSALVAGWYLWLAPRGPRRLTMASGLVVASALLLLGPAALFAIGEFGWGSVVAAVFLLNRILAVTWKQW